jgi:hypothetical protein
MQTLGHAGAVLRQPGHHADLRPGSREPVVRRRDFVWRLDGDGDLLTDEFNTIGAPACVAPPPDRFGRLPTWQPARRYGRAGPTRLSAGAGGCPGWRCWPATAPRSPATGASTVRDLRYLDRPDCFGNLAALQPQDIHLTQLRDDFSSRMLLPTHDESPTSLREDHFSGAGQLNRRSLPERLCPSRDRSRSVHEPARGWWH